MCVDPVTMAVAGSSLLSGVGSFVQSQGAASALKADAASVEQAGYSEEAQSRNDARLRMASQLAALSTRGISVSGGSPLALMAESAKNAELDALTIRTNAQNQAASYRSQASSQLASGYISAAGAFLGGASKLAELGKIGDFGGGSQPATKSLVNSVKGGKI